MAAEAAVANSAVFCACAIPEVLPAAIMEAIPKTAAKNSMEEVFLKRLHTSTRLDAVAERAQHSIFFEKKQMLAGSARLAIGSSVNSVAHAVTHSPYAVLSPYPLLSVRL
ncbi:hypothetical protein [Acidicapsa acidisoli]|uniref:hypothetical protein n=1 Tax=Acidicapsa acidisoli TaxID=1615681 RepID=UPI0021DFCD6A|nr:hypothetical protein [Acidicapsa acidisoli]